MQRESSVENSIGLEQQMDLVEGDSNLPDNNPHTFKEMFAPKKDDNFLNRALKWYVKPRGNPLTTIRVLEALQVDQFQRIPKALAKLFTRGGKFRYQSNYTIKDSRLSSLIDYGSDQTFFNEAIHTGVIAASIIPSGIVYMLSDNKMGFAVEGGAFLVNLFCVLAQRYSRARCEILIDKGLAQGKTIDYYEYRNMLNLRLPVNKEFNSYF